MRASTEMGGSEGTSRGMELSSRMAKVASWLLLSLMLAASVALPIANRVHLLGAGGTHASLPLAIGFAALGVTGSASLFFAKRRPLLVLAFVLVVTLVMRDARSVAGPSIYPLPFFYALGSYALRRSWKQVARVAAGVIGVIYVSSLLRGESLGNYGLNSLFSLLGAVTFVVPVSSLGLWFGTNRAYVRELRERSARLEHERELLAQRAVAEERVRIARDLHDVVAHHVSLMVVQAGAIRESLPKESELRGSLDVLADTGREAMAEMRRMLGVLRSEDAVGPARAPAPRLSELPMLVGRANEAGISIEYRVLGEPSALSEAEELCLYRVAQEALTNVVKHSEGAVGSVELAFAPGSVTLTVEDTGRQIANQGGPGHGLAGMRERLSLFGGTLLAEARGSDGFVVEARLPVGGVPG